ncbi:MAG TPA: hypothetical protein VF665_16640 [Longimicrobium sp.]|jgi:hypothetical protein|uniref:hypothetical protein n=1 Tax=Longimicrobium sp. TaxID=2029185 RepID=UPI002ED9BAAC
MPRLLLCLALLVGASPALAQTAPLPADSVRPGLRVRVTMEFDERTAGYVSRLDADSLVLSARGSAPPAAFSAPAIRRLELSGGRDRRTWMLAGATAGTLAGLIWAEFDRPSGDGGEEKIVMGVTRVGYAISGSLYGALAGWFGAPERWRAVNLRR